LGVEGVSQNAFDIIVIGAGIAGASVAAELSRTKKVVLLEREGLPGYHTTGRSAAVFTCLYGPPVIRALSRASVSFFENPGSKYFDGDLLKSRGLMFLARQDQRETLAVMREDFKDAVQLLDKNAALEKLPLLNSSYVDSALFDPESYDIDVDGLHQIYLKSFKAAGGDLRCNQEVLKLEKIGADWRIEASDGVFTAPIVVNAAGAWADPVAALAGISPIGLVPKRRTALLVSPPENSVIEAYPMTVDVDEEFYLKPDAGKLLISPADETPSAPCDAQPEDLDVAICVDRVEKAFDLNIRRIDHKWAGLRNFVADKCPVAGYDPVAKGFFWLAGQGGYGIQTAPALARAAAAMVLCKPLPSDITDEGVTVGDLSKDRMGIAA